MKKKMILSSVLIIVVTVALIATSFSYFVVNVDNETNPQNVDVVAGKLELIYTDCATTGSVDCSSMTKALKPGESIEKTFQIKHNGNINRDITYGIQFASVLNTFQKDELIYSVIDLDTNGEVASGAVPYNTTAATNVEIKKPLTISDGVTKKYKIKITFKDLGDVDQVYNENATFNVKMGVFIVSEA